MLNAVSARPHLAEPSEIKGVTRAISIAQDLFPIADPIVPGSPRNSGKIVLPTMEGLCFEKVKHLAYLEANGNYTTLHFTDKRQVLVCKTLGEVEQLLPANGFARIHRSHTIHLRHIKKYVRGKGGHVVLQNGTMLTVSAGQKELFLDALQQYFG